MLGSRGAGDMWPAQDGQEEPDWVRLCVVYESVLCMSLCVVYESVCCVCYVYESVCCV